MKWEHRVTLPQSSADTWWSERLINPVIYDRFSTGPWLYLINIIGPDMIAFRFHFQLWELLNWRVRSGRCGGMRGKAHQLRAGSPTGADMVIVWIIDSTCRGAKHPNPAHYPSSLALLSTCQVEMAAAPHTRREPCALMHSWHSSDAKSAVDIFTMGAIILPRLCRWGGNNGGDVLDGEAEESKGRRRVRLNLDVLGCQRNTLHLEQQHSAVLCSLLLLP